jgi:hypothetical protein
MILPERVLGRPVVSWILSGEAMGPISLRTVAPDLGFSSGVGRRRLPSHQGDVGVDALPLDVVRIADDGGFRDLRVRDERAFDFGRAQAVAGDVEDVIDAAGDPVVAVLVAPSRRRR